MNITSSGNVCIGVNTTTYKFAVVGTSSFSGLVTCAGVTFPNSANAIQFGDGSRADSAPLYFYDSNATFNGTSGHRIYIEAIKKNNNIVVINVSMQREGGVHFDLQTPGNTISPIDIAVMPVGWRPVAAVSTIGIAANNNNWATQPYNWGSFNISTAGQIRMQSPNTLVTAITTVQSNLEVITGQFVFLLSGTLYNSDGITR